MKHKNSKVHHILTYWSSKLNYGDSYPRTEADFDAAQVCYYKTLKTLHQN